MIHFDDSITLAAEPNAIATRLIADAEEFSHLQEAQPVLLVLFSQRTLFLHGGQKAAVIVQPRWQGPLGQVAETLLAHLGAPQLGASVDPDYVVIVDIAIWSVLDAERRERLIFHELSHLQPQEDEFGSIRRNKVTGKPLLKLVPHDCEVFHSELERYGPEIVGIEATCEAIVVGLKAARRRKARADASAA